MVGRQAGFLLGSRQLFNGELLILGGVPFSPLSLDESLDPKNTQKEIQLLVLVDNSLYPSGNGGCMIRIARESDVDNGISCWNGNKCLSTQGML